MRRPWIQRTAFAQYIRTTNLTKTQKRMILKDYAQLLAKKHTIEDVEEFISEFFNRY